MLCFGMRPQDYVQAVLPRRSSAPTEPSPRPVAPARSRRIARPNPSRINTSMKSSFFIKSLIMHDLKSIRISNAANKSSRIRTSSRCSYKSSIINTSKKRPGEEGGVTPYRVQTLPEIRLHSLPETVGTALLALVPPLRASALSAPLRCPLHGHAGTGHTSRRDCESKFVVLDAGEGYDAATGNLERESQSDSNLLATGTARGFGSPLRRAARMGR